MAESDKALLAAAIDWWLAMGVDEEVEDAPLDRFAAAETAVHTPVPQTVPAASSPPAERLPPPRAAASAAIAPAAVAPAAVALAAVALAEAAAAACDSLDALREAVERFEHCRLRDTASRMVFADGNPRAPVMLIGEGPGAEEDRRGLPFVGPSGRLLDRMLAAIGIDRTGIYISNAVFWRPPGNRNPTDQELAICRPFVSRHIALAGPRILVLAGAIATRALIPDTVGIMRARGRWVALEIPGLAEPVQTIAMYHPSFLLRAPERKQEAWQDLLSIQMKLQDH